MVSVLQAARPIEVSTSCGRRSASAQADLQSCCQSRSLALLQQSPNAALLCHHTGRGRLLRMLQRLPLWRSRHYTCLLLPAGRCRLLRRQQLQARAAQQQPRAAAVTLILQQTLTLQPSGIRRPPPPAAHAAAAARAGGAAPCAAAARGLPRGAGHRCRIPRRPHLAAAAGAVRAVVRIGYLNMVVVIASGASSLPSLRSSRTCRRST